MKSTKSPILAAMSPAERDLALHDLRDARALIIRGWCQNAHARNAAGAPCSAVYDRDAVAWCALGACWNIAGTDRRADRITEILRSHTVCGGVIIHNDDVCRTAEDALRWFDAAIADVEASFR